MKISNVIIFLFAIFIAIFIPYDYINQKGIAYNRGNIEYANILTAACHDAAKTIKLDSTGCAWGNDTAIDNTLDIFYKSLSSSFRLVDTPMEYSMVEKTPFVILLDTNGFYLSINACFDAFGNYIVAEDSEQVNSITGLNTFTDSINGSAVRFYLSDDVEVTLPNFQYINGNRKDVYERLVSMNMADGWEFLDNKTLFTEARINAITSRIEETINYTLNTQTVNVDSYNTGYNITLPRLTGEEWSRMLKNPTVISFLQGNQQVAQQRMFDVYAYSAGEITQTYPYFIENGEYRWGRYNITTQNQNGEVFYMHNGIPVEAFYGSMEECARKGATPAVD